MPPREPVVIPPGEPQPPVAAEEEPFEPIILRSVVFPNHKILKSRTEEITQGRHAGGRTYHLDRIIAFVNTYLRVEDRETYDTVMRRMKGRVFVEPKDGDPTAGPRQVWTNSMGQEIFATRNPDLYSAFQRKMTS